MLHLFEKFGVELEYAIVRKKDHRVASIADRILIEQYGEPLNDCELGPCAVSNELAAHVFELKSPEPTADLSRQERDFSEAAGLANEILDRHDARLLPCAMHPTMNPVREGRLWPHGNREIYEAYNRIFNCRGHGWFNLQSCHLNLPFAGDEEFARLHSAVLLLLPFMPALTAGSPFMDGRETGLLDTRIEAYRLNQARLPSIAGDVIPEPVFSKSEYNEKILAPMYAQVRPFDPDGILQYEWLNSRGAIARFERDAIEIRLLDVQESPLADIALCLFFIGALRETADRPLEKLRQWTAASPTSLRKEQLLAVVRSGMDAPVLLDEIRGIFHLPGSCRTAGELWRAIFLSAIGSGLPERHGAVIRAILDRGNLATRLLSFQRQREDQKNFTVLLTRLEEGLREGGLFMPGPNPAPLKSSLRGFARPT